MCIIASALLALSAPLTASTGQEQVSAQPQAARLVLEGRPASVGRGEVEMPAEAPRPAAALDSPLLGDRSQRCAPGAPLDHPDRVSPLFEPPARGRAAPVPQAQSEADACAGVERSPSRSGAPTRARLATLADARR